MALFLLSVVGLFIAASLLYYGFDPATNTAYRWVCWAALFTLYVSIVNLTSVIVFDVLLGAVSLKPPRILRDLLIAFAYIVVAITLLSRSGVDLTGIVVTSAVITAVVGFSLQDTLGNVMGGMALQMERSIVVGDWIKVDQQEGRVIEIRRRRSMPFSASRNSRQCSPSVCRLKAECSTLRDPHLSHGLENVICSCKQAMQT